MKPDIDYTLYLCTDRQLMTTETIEESVELAIQGGVTVVQLREKECTSREFYEMAKAVKTITDAYEVPLIINDRIDIALAVGADGVHLGQKDIPVGVARDLLGADKIVGATANTVELAKEAWHAGADYLGAGDVFGTTTKSDTKHITLDDLKAIRDAVEIPVVAIGGVNEENIALLKPTGVDGAAVISAVVGQKDITAAAEKLISNFQEA
ncbi:MAG: thiamine phosphate synthase [Eubacterium sp.]|nr:thiamine phosphate synthase [Eubacterium sp.]